MSVSHHTAQASQSLLAEAGNVRSNHCLCESSLKTVHGPGGPCGAVPVTPSASLLSISPIYHRSNERFATRDQSDVSALSCQGIEPLSTPLHNGLRFFRPPMPALPSARLTTCFPQGERVRGFHVPPTRVCEVRCLLSTEKLMVHDAAILRRTSRFQRLLAQAFQPLWLVIGDDLYRRFRFRYLHPTHCLALTRTRFPGGEASRDFSPAPPCCFGTLSRSHFIQNGRLTGWNRWFPTHSGGNNSHKRLRVALGFPIR